MAMKYQLPALPKTDTLQNISLPAVTRRNLTSNRVTALPVNVSPLPVADNSFVSNIVNQLFSQQQTSFPDKTEAIRSYLQSIFPSTQQSVSPFTQQLTSPERLSKILDIYTKLANMLRTRLGYIPEPLQVRMNMLQSILQSGNPVNINDVINALRGGGSLREYRRLVR